MHMMFQRNVFPWAHVTEVGAQVLELPYKGQELSMVVVLPDKGVDLSTVSQASVMCFLSFLAHLGTSHVLSHQNQVCKHSWP